MQRAKAAIGAAVLGLGLALAGCRAPAEARQAVQTYRATAAGMDRLVKAGTATPEDMKAFIAREVAAWEAVEKALR